jgi:nucleotide-binding universal stress UspA family protein
MQLNGLQSELDNDSIGHVICQKAKQLEPAAVVLAKHSRGRVQEFFVGSVCKHTVAHCQSPVIVVH